MVLFELGAFIFIVIILNVAGLIIYKTVYKRHHPPLSIEDKIEQLEELNNFLRENMEG